MGAKEWKEHKPKQVIPEDFKLNEKKIYKGEVKEYWRLNGYGWITLDEKNFIPDDKVFIFWSGINSSDRFPSLNKEQKVQFTMKKEKDKKGNMTIKAHAVSEIGGKKITIQDEVDSKKEFVVSQAARFKGQLKFFNPNKGFGYITVNKGQSFGAEEVPEELRVEIAEVNAGDKQPGYLKTEIPVEFGIWKDKKGQFKAHNTMKPGKKPMPTIDEFPMPSKEEMEAAWKAKEAAKK